MKKLKDKSIPCLEKCFSGMPRNDLNSFLHINHNSKTDKPMHTIPRKLTSSRSFKISSTWFLKILSSIPFSGSRTPLEYLLFMNFNKTIKQSLWKVCYRSLLKAQKWNFVFTWNLLSAIIIRESSQMFDCTAFASSSAVLRDRVVTSSRLILNAGFTGDFAPITPSTIH